MCIIIATHVVQIEMSSLGIYVFLLVSHFICECHTWSQGQTVQVVLQNTRTFPPTFATCLSLSNVSHSYPKLTLITYTHLINSIFTKCHVFIHYFLEGVLTVGMSKIGLEYWKSEPPPFPLPVFCCHPLPSFCSSCSTQPFRCVGLTPVL